MFILLTHLMYDPVKCPETPVPCRASRHRSKCSSCSSYSNCSKCSSWSMCSSCRCRGGHPDPEVRRGQSLKKFFSALPASFWLKNKGEGRSPGPSPGSAT